MSSTQEATNIILEKFKKHHSTLEKKIESSSSLDKSELKNFFDETSKDLEILQKFVADCSATLPGYDLKKCQNALNALLVNFNNKQNELLPRKKFAFSRRKTSPEKSNQPSTVTAESCSGDNNNTRATVNLLNDGFRLEGPLKDAPAELVIDEKTCSPGQDIVLTHLANIKVSVMVHSSTLHISNCTDMTLIAGPVSTSVFIENCRSCQFHLAAQQFRIHDTHASSFLLHVTSRTIIEDCSGLTFGPISRSGYPFDEKCFEKAGLALSENQWEKIDDFNHLNLEVPSPNFSIYVPSE